VACAGNERARAWQGWAARSTHGRAGRICQGRAEEQAWHGRAAEQHAAEELAW
jgi:hypothetical protein